MSEKTLPGKRPRADDGEQASKKSKLSNNVEKSLSVDGPSAGWPTDIADEDEDPAPGDASVGTSVIDPTRLNQMQRAPEASRPEIYDVCFGLLCVEAVRTPGAELPSECTPVTIDFDNRLLRVYLEDSDKPVAVLLSGPLFMLVKDFAVTLEATICTKRRKVATREESSERRLARSHGFEEDCSLRIIVYGFLEQQHRVAPILASGDLYLQHPGETEFDRRVKYLNPQYLLPPGEDMPDISKLSVYTCCGGREVGPSARGDNLVDYQRSQILNIFNTAFELTGRIPTLDPSPRLATQLKEHQSKALAMMVEKEAGVYEKAHFPSLWIPHQFSGGKIRYQSIVTREFEMTRPPPLGGGILADEMGLGKTLSSLSLICHSLDNLDKNPVLSQGLPRATLVISPKSTIHSWEKQIKTHIHPDKVQWVTYQGPRRHLLRDRIDQYDIVLTTYDTLRSDRTRQEPCLFAPKWARVVLDEAHRIRNRTSKLFIDVLEIRAECRWCLTGTPIQNCLDDFGALLEFLKVPDLDTKDSFLKRIEEPFKEKRKETLRFLRSVVAATCLRRTKADHASTLELPKKIERIEHIEMDRSTRELYNFFKHFSNEAARASRNMSSSSILVLISILRLICDHGEALLTPAAVAAWKQRDIKALTWDMLRSNTKRCVSCDGEIEDLDMGESLSEGLSCGHLLCGSCEAKSQGSSSQMSCPKCGVSAPRSPAKKESSQLSPRRSETSSPTKRQWTPSPKVEAIIRNITASQTAHDLKTGPTKSVIFSYWTKMLDLIGAALQARGMLYCRIDGRSSMSQRKEALDTFASDSGCNIMLASIGAAGEGIDLTAATTVHLVEPHWNPMAEDQAIDRVHRIGQKQDVEVVRYIVGNSIEPYVQWVQNYKSKLIKDSLSATEEDLEGLGERQWKRLIEFLKVSE